ncbi:MAG: 1-deoxy-D-xylulose-5-phosphate reductoisomerase, partial [Candidatus Binataceae bacterium]
AFALAYPERLPLSHLKTLSLIECGALTFEAPDLSRFPCLRLAYDALAAGGTMPACLNAANEELVAAFLGGRLSFTEIPRQLEAVMLRHDNRPAESLEDLLEIDGWARMATRERISAAAA